MMGMQQAFNEWGTVTHVSYESRPQMGADAVRVTLVTDGSETTDDALRDASNSVYEYPVTNADWHIENPWLALLAYCGAQPSTVEDDFVGSTVPLQTAGDSVEIPMTVFGNGQAILRESDWGPDV